MASRALAEGRDAPEHPDAVAGAETIEECHVRAFGRAQGREGHDGVTALLRERGVELGNQRVALGRFLVALRGRLLETHPVELLQLDAGEHGVDAGLEALVGAGEVRVGRRGGGFLAGGDHLSDGGIADADLREREAPRADGDEQEPGEPDGDTGDGTTRHWRAGTESRSL